ncbi:MAG: Uma2 family endonuclease [Polyangiaceae bacterium]|nr:Uma2 family endonuclease [Polyangiaceae bacterium]
MGSPAERVPSFEELYQAIVALPPGLTGEIIEPGTIRTMGRPGAGHRIAARGIAGSLGGDDAWDGGQGWWIEQEAEIRFGERLLVPDLSGWRVSAEQELPPKFVFGNPIAECPRWCCEILSPSTEVVDRERKLPLYASSGVEWIWLVDPEKRTLEVFRNDDGTPASFTLVEGNVARILEPFASLIRTERWWIPE